MPARGQQWRGNAPSWEQVYEKRWYIKRIKTSVIKMEQYKRSKLLSDSSVSTCLTKNWIEVNYPSGDQYSYDKNIRFKSLMLRSDLCDYGDVYTVVKGRISVTGTNTASRWSKKLTFKNNAPLKKYKKLITHS